MIERRLRIPVAPPFRLDLTTALIRRFSDRAGTSASDSIDGAFVCAVPGAAGPTLVEVTQSAADSIELSIDGVTAVEQQTSATICRMLGLEAKLDAVERAAATIPWLSALFARMRGVRPMRYPGLWEAAVNAIVFQSVSMLAAGAVIDRFIASFGTLVRYKSRDIEAFPSARAILESPTADLRATGLSAAKVVAVRTLAEAVQSADWDEQRLEALSTPSVCALLCELRGIGPWSAAVIALRGLGRLDVFPLRDSGVVRTVAELSGHKADAVADALAALGDSRGMLYHLLLLARLEARGKLASTLP